MKNNSILLFTKDINHIPLIRKIKDYALSYYDEYIDFGIIYNISQAITFNDIALLPSFYLRFYSGPIIFLNIEDYLEHKDLIIGQPIIYLSNNTPENVSRNMIKNCDIITEENNTFKIIKYHAI